MDKFPMIMEVSSLNRAHQEQRKAEALLSQKKFDECIECHKNAIELLSETCKLTTNIKALESLNLQKEYNQKQINLVKLKKSQEFHKQSEELTQRMFNLNTYEQNENVEAVINKTFEVHDSLIEYLGKHGTVEDAIKSLSDIEEKHNEGQILGVKHPKNENQMIEELKILSVQLKNTVKCLVAELDDRNKEIEGLKERIKVLESEKTAESKSSGVKVEAISPGVTSPFVFSPGSELSPDINQQSIILPPLEMPNLDFLKLYKSSSNEDSTK